jgi:hypothetical protein
VRRPLTIAAAGSAVLVVAGCGLNVQSADLFVLTRSGPTGRLTLLVNDGGTIRCDGGKARPLPDPLLLQARDLAQSLDDDVVHGRRFQGAPAVYGYAVKLQDGTLTFPDRAAVAHKEVAQAEQFTLRVVQGPCAGARGA